ncbi:acyltransferase [Amycolatopsis nigrescens]|uniref:acyltransferase n=1 Tax=Amycolatopsis nigrescens TaxID=381445 RepID=UPI000380058E|nr:acyltransferase [Amycolatopsis nigrescens]
MKAAPEVRAGWPAKLRRELGIELGFLTKRALLNVIAGSTLMPRVPRWALYRACGIDARTMNIFPGLQLAGRPRNLRIGRGTFVNVGCFFELVAEVAIGEDCQLGMQTMVVTSHHAEAHGEVSRRPVGRPVRIGNRVWTGARVTILPGVRIADDAVIAAGAVVTADCPEPGVYAGVPARLVRARTGQGHR